MRELWCVGLVLSAAMVQYQQVPPTERAALMELFNATGGPNWKRNAGWGSKSSPCEWEGVWCDFLDGDEGRRVISHLNLSDNNMRGVLPDSIASLAHLKGVDLVHNQLTGRVPDRWLDLYDQHRFELNLNLTHFSNLVARAKVQSDASLLCSVDEDLISGGDFDFTHGRATRKRALLQPGH